MAFKIYIFCKVVNCSKNNHDNMYLSETSTLKESSVIEKLWHRDPYQMYKKKLFQK